MGIDLSALIGGVNRGFTNLGEGRREGEDRQRRISQEDEELARRRQADALAESIRTGEMEKAAQEQARLRQERGVAEANLTEGIRAAEGRLDPTDVAAIGNLTGQARLDALGELETRQREAAEATLAQQRNIEARRVSLRPQAEPDLTNAAIRLLQAGGAIDFDDAMRQVEGQQPMQFTEGPDTAAPLGPTQATAATQPGIAAQVLSPESIQQDQGPPPAQESPAIMWERLRQAGRSPEEATAEVNRLLGR